MRAARPSIAAIRLVLSVLLGCLSWAAHAEAYRCRQPDGSVSFQDRPCSAGAVSTPLALPAVSASPAREDRKPGSASWQDQDRDFRTRREQQDVKSYNDDVMARNRAERCSAARKQLGLLNEGRPVYRRDDNGDRQYVKDENRPAEAASARRRVADECG